jgi:hypothetical protein
MRFQLQLLSEVMSAQILLDTCAYASSGPRTATEKLDGDVRKILSEEAGILMGKQVKNPPPRVPPGCIVSEHIMHVHCHHCIFIHSLS